jgi:hypothetical protein
MDTGDGRQDSKPHMTRRMLAALLGLAIGGLTLAAVQAQQRGATAAVAFTGADYAEIQQLVARYSYAVDTHADNGYAYADLFAPDGAFGQTTGREQLAALARKTQPERAGPNYARHFLTNVIIRPSSDGATGTQYLIAIDVGEGGKPSTIVHGGRYEDVYVKTPQGWRFKSRVLIPSKVPEPPPNTGAPR